MINKKMILMVQMWLASDAHCRWQDERMEITMVIVIYISEVISVNQNQRPDNIYV